MHINGLGKIGKINIKPYSMRRNIPNINTPEYWDDFYGKRDVDTKNLLRQEKYLDIIGTEAGLKVVELACGNSFFPEMVAERNMESWGLDFAPKMISNMAKKFPKVRYVLGSVTETRLPNDYFDAVVAGEIIEHLEEPISLLREMSRICKRNGKIIISTPILECEEPEHLWEFWTEDVSSMMSPFGEPHIEVVPSTMFPGRSYIIAWCFNEKIEKTSI